MNVYQVREDGELRLFVSDSMAGAIAAAFATVEADETKINGRLWTTEERAEEREHWESSILESVTLVGQLENPKAVRHLLNEWERNIEVTRDVLELAGATKPVPLDVLAERSNEELRDAEEWAGAIHARASDNDDVEVPPMPAWLEEFR